MTKPGTKGLLKKILSDDLEWVYVEISDKAVEWAITGFIEEANMLLEKLWSCNIPHSEHLRLQDEGLQVLWTISNKKPLNIPFVFKEINQIEHENWSRVFYPCGGDAFRESISRKRFEELNHQELFIKAINSGYDNSEKPEKILEALKIFLKSDNAVGHPYYHAATCGALLAARNNLPDYTESFIQLWGEGSIKYWANYSMSSLMRDRNCAEYLLKGSLNPVFKLTRELIQSEISEIIDALIKRMINGRTLFYKKLSWKQLLNKISKNAIKQKTIELSEKVLLNKSLNKPPATMQAISAAEKRLNIILPDDYKKFLLTSNGFERFSITGVTLAPVEKIEFLTIIDKELIDIWAESMDEFDLAFGVKLRNSIIIGGFQEEQQLLLIPLQDNNWECWHFSSWRPGAEIYMSFRFYIEGELKDLEDELHVD